MKNLLTLSVFIFLLFAANAKAQITLHCVVPPDVTNFSFQGGVAYFAVNPNPLCSSETPTATDSWITITDVGVYQTFRTYQISVPFNPGLSRSLTIAIAGVSYFSINQAGQDCTFTPSTTSASFTSAPNGGSFGISAIGGCVWHAVSNNDWITINNGASWSGSGTVGYIVAVNPNGVARTGTITVGGNTFAVTQAGTEKTRKRVRIL